MADKGTTVTGIQVPATLSQELRPIGEELHRIHESVLWSAQVQFERHKWWRGFHNWVGGGTAAIAAIAGATGLAKFDIWWLPPSLALVAAGLAAVLTTLNPSERSASASSAANAYLEMQTEARQFLTVDLLELDKDAARERLADLTKRRDELNKIAEPPGSRAYKSAKRFLESGSQSYEQDGGS